MNLAAARHAAIAAWLGVAVGTTPVVHAQTSAAGTDRALITRSRVAIDEIRRFELVAAAIAKRCQEPVASAYQDWREEFAADIKRVQLLDRTLQQRAPTAAPDIAADPRLAPFADAEGQVLYSRCLRWSTLLIQRESPLRATLVAQFLKIRDDEAELRRLLADEGRWRAAQAAESPP